jgi:ribonucleoside-diphosphate reductase alpha chain
MYYLRSKAAVDPIKFTLDEQHQRVQANAAIAENEVMDLAEGAVCTMEEGCIMCGS